MLKEAADMLDDLNDIYEEERFSIPDTDICGTLTVDQHIRSPKPISNHNNSSKPENENCFLGNLTLGLMRSSSIEFPMENMNFRRNVDHSTDANRLFPDDLEEPYFSDFEVTNSRPFDIYEPECEKINTELESPETWTGKFSPNEGDMLGQLDLSSEKASSKKNIEIL